LSILQDAITGNGQKGSAFWEHIFQHYNIQRPFHFRPARSLESRWGLLKHDVSKFIWVLQQCVNFNISGANAGDVLQKALELYHVKSAKNTEFGYLHVWEFLKDVPCWNLGNIQDKSSTPVMKRKEVSLDSDFSFLQPSNTADGKGSSPATSSRSRPQGSNFFKEE